MKFAALIALVSASQMEDYLTEDVHAHYNASTVKKVFGMFKQLEQLGNEAEADFHKKNPHFERDMKKMGQWVMSRYGGDLMAWKNSKSVRAVEMHK